MTEIQVIESENLSKGYDRRYVVINKETGEILDDAQGYGYRTPQKAHAAWAYKNRDKSKDKEKSIKNNKIKQWLKKNKDFTDELEDINFQYAKENKSINSKVIDNILSNMKLETEFTSSDIFNVWRKM